MAIVKLRSPVYRQATQSSGTVASVKMELSIDSTLRYTIIKDASAGVASVFDISELARDYLDPTITLDPASYPQNQISISTSIKFYSQANAGGTQTGSTQLIADKGVDGYGTFSEGSNPAISPNQFAFSKDYANNEYHLYVPVGEGGAYQYFDGTGIETQDFTSGDTSDSQTFGSVTINRIDCTKYGKGTKIVFINKFGALQELWFFLKKTQTTNTTRDLYKRNLLSGITYDTKVHANKIFNKQLKQTHKLSSGYYKEWTNTWFEQLLASESVWLIRDKFTNPSTKEVVPVNVKSSSLTHKTTVNDKLIHYEIEFEEAFDYINNVR